jgi:hypothetical protein
MTEYPIEESEPDQPDAVTPETADEPADLTDREAGDPKPET